MTTPTDVLELLDDENQTPTAVITSMIREAMAVADGTVPDLDGLREKLDDAEELADEHGSDPASRAALRTVRLTPLDPQRPARDMLEDLVTGIRGCWLLYREYADRSDLDEDADDQAYDEMDDEIDTAFCDDVRAEAAAQRHRLGLAPAPDRTADTAPGHTTADHHDDDDEDGVPYTFDLEADDICEQITGAVVDTQEPDLPRQIIEQILTIEDDEAGRVLAQMIARGLGYLAHMKESRMATAEFDAAVNWVGTQFGVDYAGPAAIMAGVAGHRESQRILAKQLGVKHPTIAQLSDFLGPDLFPATIWLCAGLVETVGDGAVSWLQQYRPKWTA